MASWRNTYGISFKPQGHLWGPEVLGVERMDLGVG